MRGEALVEKRAFLIIDNLDPAPQQCVRKAKALREGWHGAVNRASRESIL